MLWRLPAQHFNYRLHDENSGLCCSTTFDIYQDKKGYIWIATAGGVLRYNGNSYSNILPDSAKGSVFKIYEDDFERIWFVSVMGSLSYYDKLQDKVFLYKYNKATLSAVNDKKNVAVRDFGVLKDCTLVFGTIGKGFFTVSPNGVIKNKPLKKIDVRDNYILQKNGGMYSCYSEHDENTKRSARLSIYDNDKEIYSFGQPYEVYNNNCFYIPRKNGHVIFTAFGHLVDLYNGKVQEILTGKSNIISLSEDSDSCLWVGYLDGGVKRIPPNKPVSCPQGKIFFHNLQVSRVTEDHEHGFWFSTLENGIIYVPETKLESFEAYDLSIKREKLSSLASDGGSRVFAGTTKGEVKTYSRGNLVSAVTVGDHVNSIRALFFDPLEKRLYIGGDGVYYVDDNNKVIQKDPTLCVGFFRQGTDFYSVALAGVSKNFEFEKKGLIRKSGTTIRLYSAYTDSRKKTWIGTAAGLYYMKDSNLVEQPDALWKDEIIYDITEIAGNLYVATKNKGLLRWDGKKAEPVFVHGSLKKHILFNLYRQNDSILWISSTCGLYKYNVRSEKAEFMLNKNKGLYSNYVRDFLILNDTGYVVTQDGVSYFNVKDNFRNNAAPPVYIHDFIVDSVSYAKQQSPVLKYNSKYINIAVEGLTYRQTGKKLYTYRLKGYSEEWQQSNSDNIQLASLPSGSYTFEVKAQNEDGVFSSQPAVFSFIIRKPLWRELWFQMLLLLLAAIVTAIIFYTRLKRIKKANKIMEQLSNYKQQALSMQMNPHFIFNSLNSIQAYVLSEKPMKAAKYLAVFSKLMRKSLDNSRKEFIPIEEEVNTLELYLQLESNRAKHLFEFWFDYDKEQLKDIMIPPMLIQPHIENAIKHGFKNRENKKAGSIKISFVMRNQSLYCAVEDNGVGYKNTEAMPESKANIHKSAGIDVTRTRLELLCKNHGFEFYFEIKDRPETVPGETGTIVEFIIPYLYETKSIDS